VCIKGKIFVKQFSEQFKAFGWPIVVNSFYFMNQRWIFWLSYLIGIENKAAVMGLIILPLVRKMTNLVFAALTAILFARNQFDIFWSSVFTYVVNSPRFLPFPNPVVSSANKTENNQKSLI
jgi:hypothetical protein